MKQALQGVTQDSNLWSLLEINEIITVILGKHG